MANVVRFYRGLEAFYNATTHADGIYFATDVGRILMNGVEYGGDSDKKVANVELNLQANGIVITYTDTTSTTLLFGKASTVADGLMSKEDKASIESLQASVEGKQETLTAGDAVSITEDNVIDVKIEEVSGQLLTKSANGLRAHISSITGAKIKVGTAITGGVEIGADQTVAAGMQALSNSIQTAVTDGITSITSPDNTIKVTSEGTSRGLAVDMSKLVSTSSSIQVGPDGKLDIFWSENE